MKSCALVLASAFVFASCTNSSGGSARVPGACNALSSSLGIQSLLKGQALKPQLATNQSQIVIGGNYINEITTSVTICEPANPSNCQTIPDVLVDTGSNGLRLFHCSIIVNLPNVTDNSGNPYGTCVQYADTSSHWGAVKSAFVKVGGITTSTAVPIQVIDASFGTVPSTCTNLETDPSATGYNGIIGVGLLSNDCPSCTAAGYGQNPQYYSCSGSGCAYQTFTDSHGNTYAEGAAIVTAKQVTNPVSAMASGYNNGVSITIPQIGDSGSTAIAGTLTLGISSTAGNLPSTNVKAFAADPTSLSFTTNYNGQPYSSSFIDSGSNAYYFPDSNDNCTLSGFVFYCPTNPSPRTGNMTSVTAPNPPNNSSVAANFIVTNARTALSTANPNTVFPGFAGGGVTQGGFDWGLPFFMGRTVYVGIKGVSAGWTTITGNDPYWAFDTSVTPNPN